MNDKKQESETKKTGRPLISRLYRIGDRPFQRWIEQSLCYNPERDSLNVS